MLLSLQQINHSRVASLLLGQNSLRPAATFIQALSKPLVFGHNLSNRGRDRLLASGNLGNR
jgi:hypothetical protein